MLSGMDDPEMGKVQTLQHLVHRFGCFRGFAEFAFNSIASAVKNEEEINLSTTMGGPEKCLGRFNDPHNLFDGKAFPRCPHPGIAVKGLKMGKVKQSVKNPRIPQVYLGCFNLALADILIPRLKLPDHKGSRENVKIGAHRLIRQVEGTVEQIARTARWKDSWLSEGMCLLAAVLLPLIGTPLHLVGATATYDPSRAVAEGTLVSR